MKPLIFRRSATNAIVACIIAVALPAKARAQRNEIVISASELATPEQFTDMPTPGKWWLNRNAQSWSAKDGTILMTGQPSDEPAKDGIWEVIPIHRYTPQRVPELVVDPKFAGRYRIYAVLDGD